MKQLLTSLLLAGAMVASQHSAFAQQAPSVRPLQNEPVRYEYCELMHTGALSKGKPEKTKTDDIYVDFGYGYEKLGGSEQMKREAGKMDVFATPISAVNYMGSLGWEIVQIMETPTTPGSNDAGRYVRRYMLRRLLTAKAVAVPR
ncbi:hypothetical protein [Hymenobacter mucosus]|uniref:Uncharacterized protein n=1 Tax=Hymenobacter mucosus TaxID=1411120 RepID=A0A238XWY4_9BACT|nr:hypothetical protein [Hymenobacter mucosus]SNR63031.1 hypothetical protein SAMN06269173_104441 [Hymenobacter mucosus]